jgi:hypothetical protein
MPKLLLKNIKKIQTNEEGKNLKPEGVAKPPPSLGGWFSHPFDHFGGVAEPPHPSVFLGVIWIVQVRKFSCVLRVTFFHPF